MILYEFLKLLAKIGVTIFFRKITLIGRENLQNKGPAILAVNHPNTLMDVLLVASHASQRVGFLANAPLFTNPFVGKLLTYLGAIPVYRQQDVKKGEIINNEGSFSKCIEYLEKGGTIMVFPEGSSFSEMKLRKLKTGLGRIALDYGNKTRFSKDLSIIPIGLNYSSPLNFRSKVILNTGKSISIKDFEAAYNQDRMQAVHHLNDNLKQRFEEQLIILENKQQEKLFKDLVAIFPEIPTIKAGFPFQYAFAEKLRKLKAENASNYTQLEQLSQNYQEVKNALKLSNESVEVPKENGILMLLKAIGMLILFPLSLFGWITNFIPYVLAGFLPPRVTKEIEYWAVIKLVMGILLFPLWYFILTIGFAFLFSLNVLQPFLLAVSFPISGLFALFYMEKWRMFRENLNMRMLKKRRSTQLLKLKNWQKEVQKLMHFNTSHENI